MWGRRIVSAATAALVTCVSLVGPSSAAPEAVTWAGDQAFAVWLRSEGKEIVAYVAVAVTATDVQPNQAFVERSVCIRQGRGGFVCRFPPELQPIGPTDFFMDPLLREATLNAELDGVQHSITWVADHDHPIIVEGATVGPSVVGTGGAMVRFTNASGNMFGKELVGGFFDMSVLVRQAGAYVVNEGMLQAFTVRADGMRYRFVPR